MSKMVRTAVSRLTRAMAPLFSIYKLGSRNLVEGYELGVGESLGGKVDFFLSSFQT